MYGVALNLTSPAKDRTTPVKEFTRRRDRAISPPLVHEPVLLVLIVEGWHCSLATQRDQRTQGSRESRRAPGRVVPHKAEVVHSTVFQVSPPKPGLTGMTKLFDSTPSSSWSPTDSMAEGCQYCVRRLSDLILQVTYSKTTAFTVIHPATVHTSLEQLTAAFLVSTEDPPLTSHCGFHFPISSHFQLGHLSLTS